MKHSSSLGLRNLTPEDESLLEAIGVTTKAQFEKLGAEKTYLLLLEEGTEPDAHLLFRLRGAERDVDWQILAERDQKRAKSRFADVDEP
jgi:hypothetical protein